TLTFTATDTATHTTYPLGTAAVGHWSSPNVAAGSLVSAALPVGSYTITASYDGDPFYSGSWTGTTSFSVASAAGTPADEPPAGCGCSCSDGSPVGAADGADGPAPGLDSATKVRYGTGTPQVTRRPDLAGG